MLRTGRSSLDVWEEEVPLLCGGEKGFERVKEWTAFVVYVEGGCPTCGGRGAWCVRNRGGILLRVEGRVVMCGGELSDWWREGGTVGGCSLCAGKKVDSLRYEGRRVRDVQTCGGVIDVRREE